MSSIILGIDPGSLRTGFGVVRVTGDRMQSLAQGVICMDPQDSMAQRLAFLHQELSILFAKLKPHTTVVEKVFLGRNADSAFKLGHARGVAMALAAGAGSEVFEYAARFVKKAVTGSGAANKETVQMLVLNLLNLSAGEAKFFDATDALALAICHARVFESKAKMQHMMEKTL